MPIKGQFFQIPYLFRIEATKSAAEACWLDEALVASRGWVSERVRVGWGRVEATDWSCFPTSTVELPPAEVGSPIIEAVRAAKRSWCSRTNCPIGSLSFKRVWNKRSRVSSKKRCLSSWVTSLKKEINKCVNKQLTQTSTQKILRQSVWGYIPWRSRRVSFHAVEPFFGLLEMR